MGGEVDRRQSLMRCLQELVIFVAVGRGYPPQFIQQFGSMGIVCCAVICQELAIAGGG